jgi:diguanylate cyclase (GGDEF)-like protein/PAS domain S-box-containing protein
VGRQKHMHLLRRIWPLLLSNFLMLLLAVACMDTLSAMRAFVAGESLWSKAQKDAAAHLREFARTRDLSEFGQFRATLAIPLGDRAARLALLRPDPDLAEAVRDLTAGGNNPADISGMIRLLRLAPYVPYMASVLDIWAQGDALIDQLDDNADLLLDELVPGRYDDSGRLPLLAEIDRIDRTLGPLEEEFSATLGAASRATALMLEASAALSFALFLAIAVILSRAAMRRADVMEQALHTSERRAAAEQNRAQVALASIHDGVLTTDAEGRIDFLNAVASDISGWSLDDARGLPLGRVLRLAQEDTADPVGSALHKLKAGIDITERLPGAVLIARDGRRVPLDCSLAPIRDGLQAVSGIVAVMRDVSRERELAARLMHQATHDELTGLVNRREFERRLSEALARAGANAEPAALLYLDLDQFKIVNDTCGHPAGDELICRVAETIRAAVRTHDTLARLGGDEFGLLLEACSPNAALAIAETIRSSLAELRFAWDKRVFVVGVSIGMVALDASYPSVSELLSAADNACYLAKDAGRNRVQVYRPGDRKVRSRSGEMNWVARLAEALEQSRFVLFAQVIEPIADPALERSHEVLVRMLDADGRVVAPMRFIPAAERYGLMPRIDRWVIERTLAELGALQRSSRRPPRLVVNLSATSVGDPELLAFIAGGLRRHHVAPDRLGFELTETAAVTQLASASRLLTAIRALGCSIGLDDFGSGMSSFGYLRRLPVDYVKIDGSFVHKMDADPVDRAMVASIHQIVRVMGLRTVAERVEHLPVLAELRRIGVDFAQGYAISRPVPLIELLDEDARPSAGGDRTAARAESP